MWEGLVPGYALTLYLPSGVVDPSTITQHSAPPTLSSP